MVRATVGGNHNCGKFAELLVKGEIKPETFEEWNRETGRAKLPERVKPAKKKSSKRKAKSKRSAA